MRATTEDEAESEYAVLTTATGRDLLARVSAIARPLPKDLVRMRAFAPVALVEAAFRLVEGRRRAAAKFSRASEMWFEPVAVQQATPEAVACHKAARFAGSDAVDLCCGIGGDAVALANAAARVVAVDRDRGMVRRALWNAVLDGNSGRLLGVVSRAEAFPIPPSALVHIDPDRRATGGSRSKSILGYAPGLEFLRSLPSLCRGGAIKLGPASDFEGHFGDPSYEIEVISLGGECKEATAWFGPLASCRRRATVLPDGASWTDRDGGGPPRFSELSAVVFDPDPALIRSGLLDGFASAHGLARFAIGIDLLTGPAPIASPFLSPILVDDVLPLDMKTLRRVVADRHLGPLEIKTRGVELRPEAVRVALRPEGPNPATIVLVGGKGRACAIVGRRVPALGD